MNLWKNKIILIILLIILFSGVKVFYKKESLKVSKEKYSNIIPISKDVAILEKNKEYFYKNKTVKKKLKYTNIEKISKNYIKGKRIDKTVLMDLDCNEINLPEFDKILSISEERYILLERENKQFYYDLLEEKKIGDYYDQLGVFSENKALYLKDNKIGFMDNTGKEVIKNRFKAAGEFQNGYAVVVSSSNGKYRYIDEKGTESYDEYDYIKSFQSKVLILKKDEINILNNNGIYLETKDEIIPLNNDYYLFKNGDINKIFRIKTSEIIEEIDGEYLGVTGNEVIIKNQNNYIIFNLQLENIRNVQGRFEKLEIYRNDYFTAREGKKTYIYNKDGNKFSKGFDIIYPRVDGMFLVGEESGYGALNDKAKKILETKYDSLQIVPEYLIAELDGKKRLFNFSGKDVLNKEYDDIKYISENIYIYDIDGWRYIYKN